MHLFLHIIKDTISIMPFIFHPKGIQEKTMQMILDYMKENTNQWLTGDKIAEKVGLTGVTVRRYMSHLTETGMFIGDMNYETGGRPCMIYKITK